MKAGLTTQTDWTWCMFYQEVKIEKLVNSTESKQLSNWNETFDLLEEDLWKLETESIDDISVYKFSDVEQKFSETWLLHHAKFYKMCRNPYDNHHFQRAKKKIGKSGETPSELSESCSKATRSSFSSSNFQPTCLFFDSRGGCLHNVSSFVINRHPSDTRQVAVLLGDDKLVDKLSEGDIPAIEAKYHPSCLWKLYSRAAHLQNSSSNNNKRIVTYEIVLSETIYVIRKELKKSETALIEWAKKMFISAYHCYSNIKLYSTRFKEQLLSRIPGLQAHKRGKQIVLTSGNVASEAIVAALSCNGDQNGLQLVQTAKLVRQDLFDGEASFSGNFSKGYQTESVSKSLLVLVQMILEGTSLSLAQFFQLIKFNTLKWQRDRRVVNVRHWFSQITALPFYTGVLINLAWVFHTIE